MSLVQRRINVTITLGTGDFGEQVGDTVTLKNHRVTANMAAVGGAAQGSIELRIFGLTLDEMNRITTVGLVMASRRGKNRLKVEAYDDSGLVPATIFDGGIDQAWADFKSAPEVALNIVGLSAAVAAVKPVPPSSYKGSADVATIMSDLAKTMGLTFENNGVSVKLSNPYFPGTAWDQVRACAKAADINMTVDNGVLAIWPKDSKRAGDVPLIGPETGLVGYPEFTSSGLVVTSRFFPNVRAGGQINVKTSLSVAAGIWNVFSIVHRLDAQTPGGAWFTYINCYREPT